MSKNLYSVDDRGGALERHLTPPWALAEREIPWNVYPRPQLKRDSFLCLNGKWELTCLRDGKTEEDWGQILVPFPPESPASGVEKMPGKDDVLVYRRKFTLPDGFNRGRVILHFGAADTLAEVSVNGQLVGGHVGGYLPFSFEITELLAEENELTVRVQDPLDTDLAYGKQRLDRGGMWYTPISGLWQTVWLESVPEVYIAGLRLTPWYDHCEIEVLGEGTEGLEKRLHIENDKTGPADIVFTGSSYLYLPEFFHPWSPADPYLYRFTLEMGDDRVESYFAMRSVTIGTPDKGFKANQAHIHLNGSAYYFQGVLDQGYYPDGIYLPATPEGYETDILRMKECGFNMLRKHIKIEPDLFYYECDRLGMAVFQDIPNSGRYNFLHDTALATAGLGRERRRVSARRRGYFEDALAESVRFLYNKPCVFWYTLFNEGWGQYDSGRLYDELKALDPTRVIDTASGWFKPGKTDVNSKHIYFKEIKLPYERDKVTALTEFGGYAHRVEGHCFNKKKAYGYRSYPELGEYRTAVKELYGNHVLPEIAKGLVATVYTQLSDVEDEINGLLTYDRQVLKVDPAEMRALYEKCMAIRFLREQDTESAVEKVGEPGGILLLGDSITDFYNTRSFLSDLRVYNRGFSGNRSDQLVDALPHTLGLLHPEKIVILIGANDIGHGFDNAHVLKNLQITYDYIQKRAPGVPVILVSVMPSNPADKADMPNHYEFTSVRPNEKILALNAELRPFAEAHGWTYLDANPHMQDERGYLREEYTLEGLHFVDPGYEQYTKLLRPLLEQK